MTRAWLIAALLAAAAGVASASPTPMVGAPAGWRADAEQAAGIAKTVAAGKPFGDPAATVAAEVYVPPGAAKISLVVARATTRDAHLDRGAAAQSVIDDLRGTVSRSRLSGAGAVEDKWEAGLVAADAQAQAFLAWHDPGAGTREEARIVVAADAATLVEVTGECVAAADAPAPLLLACKAALASLDPGIPRADRVTIAAPAPSPEPEPEPTSGSGKGTGTGTGTGSSEALDVPMHPVPPPAQMGDGSRVSLPPMVIPPEPPATDRRPVYVGGGIVILALAFYWNRRNRERFEPEADKPDADKPDAGKDEEKS